MTTDTKETLSRTKWEPPKANVVRISLLSAKDRERYLGTIDSAIDGSIKQKIYDKVYKSYPVFYGLMQGGNDFTLGITPQWTKSTSGASVGGMLRDLASKTSVGDTIGAAGEIMKAMTGINASATGSSTMKSYEGSDLSGFNVECGWYLPEQLELCRHSLQVLMRMGYPVQVSDTDLATAMDAVVGAVHDGVAKALSSGPTTSAEQSKNLKVISGAAEEPASTLATAGAGVVSFVTNALGMNLVLDPLPVRCTLGHYADIEPLVIEDIKVTYTKDTFVDQQTGRHLPVKCNVTIQFKFWLTPAPKLQFLEMLGQEMFGEGLDMPAQAATTAAHDNLTLSQQAQLDSNVELINNATTGRKSMNLLVNPSTTAGGSDTIRRQ